LETYNTAYYHLVKNLTSISDQEGVKETQGLFREVMDQYGISKVAPLALPQLAFLNYQEKNYDEAISLYEAYLDEVMDNPPYRSLTWLAMAACYEEKDEREKAVEILKRIVAQPEGYFKEQALWQLARLYRLSDRNEESKEMLETFLEEFETSPYAPMARALLKDLP
jgi:tetratricopeptide (TPR) repeat protein